MAKPDPPLITLALKAALPKALVRDRKAFDKLLGKGTETEGSGVDVTDANGDTAAARLAKRALANRVKHWESHGAIGADPVSYTITDGVMVFRKRGRVIPMKLRSEVLIAMRWCKQHHAFLNDLIWIHNLFFYGASLTAKGKDGKTVQQHLEAVGHRFAHEAIADHPLLQRKLARRIGGAKQAALRRDRDNRKHKKLVAAHRAAMVAARRTGEAKKKR